MGGATRNRFPILKICRWIQNLQLCGDQSAETIEKNVMTSTSGRDGKLPSVHGVTQHGELINRAVRNNSICPIDVFQFCTLKLWSVSFSLRFVSSFCAGWAEVFVRHRIGARDKADLQMGSVGEKIRVVLHLCDVLLKVILSVFSRESATST